MRIAVIGSGIAGLSAAYLLSRRHQVTLFERESRLGGHTNTVVVPRDGGCIALDTGFIVHNHRTYPNLVRLFGELGVDTRPSDMSFSVSCANRRLEYSSRGLSGFFAQAKQLAAPSHYRLLRQIARFNRRAPETLNDPAYEGVTVRDYLRDQQFDALFADCYLLPITSAIWSASMDDVGRFPVSTIVRFLYNHGMLSIGTHPTWFVVEGGSHTYIPKIIAPLKSRVHCDARLLAVRRHAAEVVLTFANREALSFDHVVFACHGDQVLPLLTDPSGQEHDVFSRFTTTANDVWLHTDASFLPASPRARASWNYQVTTADAPPQVTYHLNRLQSIDTVFATTLTGEAGRTNP